MRLNEFLRYATRVNLGAIAGRTVRGMLLFTVHLSAYAQVPPPPKHPALDENGVDVQSGTAYYPHTELTIGQSGTGGLEYTRYYYGSSYATNFDSSFVVNNYYFGTRTANVLFGRINEDFSFFFATEPTGSMVIPEDGAGTGDYSRKDGLHVRFGNQILYNPADDSGHSHGASVAEYAEFPNGVRWTYHHRQFIANGLTYYRPQSITSNAGYQLKFVYASNITPTSSANSYDWMRVVRVVAINNAHEYCDPSADSCALNLAWRQVQDAYSNNVLTVTEPSGAQARYTSGNMRQLIKTARSASDNIIYNFGSFSGQCYPDGLCAGQRYVTSAEVNGRITTYTYSYSSALDRWIVESNSPLSHKNIYRSKVKTGAGSLMPGVAEHVNALDHLSSFTYNAAADVLTAAFPEGNRFEYTRDGDGNLQQAIVYPKSSSSLANILVSQTGPDNAPTSKTDARGNLTSYTYKFASPEGVLTETGPADASGIHPVKRYAYLQRYAWIKNSSGGYVRAPTPLWVRTEERTCAQTATVGSACAGGSADEIVTVYDYGPDSGPNNLLVRGKTVTASGVTLRVCYGYDIYGNKISETSPRAGLANCS